MGEPPAWTSRIASSSLAGASRFNRYPLAPAASALKILSVSSKTVSMTIWVCWHARLELAHALDAAHAAQVDVHQHHIRLILGEAGQSLFGAGVSADAAEAPGGIHEARDVLAQIGLVIHYCDLNDFAHIFDGVPAPRGTLSVTVAPPPGRLEMAD